MPPRAADRGPAGLLPRVLEADPIALAIAQHHHRRTGRDQLVHLLDQRDREVFGNVPLGPLIDDQRRSARLSDREREGRLAE